MTSSLIFFLTILVIILILLPRMITAVYAQTRIFELNRAPYKRVAIVFGAGLWKDGTPTPILQDRVKTAALLYHNGKVEKLLLSGDKRQINYNEPAAMRDFAISLDVPEQDIVLDNGGRRTYDTCYRAKAIFGVREAILVTQRYHLPRAIFICNKLKLNSIGVISKLSNFRTLSLLYWNLREIPASIVAFWDIYFRKPVPISEEPQPIFPKENK